MAVSNYRRKHRKSPGHRRGYPGRRTWQRAPEALERRELLAADVIINEFLASNDGGLLDQDNEASDWIELYNRGDESVNLEGWSISDDEEDPQRWVFPAVELPADGYLVIFASSKNRNVPGDELHTNFKLNRDGETLGLFHPDKTVADQILPEYPPQETDVSFGVGAVGDTAGRGYMLTPTPGAANQPIHWGFVEETVQISLPGGIYDAPVEVRLDKSTTSELEIRYTTDGSLPSASNGLIYTEPLTIDSITTLRAGVVRPGYITQHISTSTYIFLDDVLTQTRPEGYPDLNSGDYDMDPDIALSQQYHDRLLAGLRDIPTMSIVLPQEDLLGPQGVYTNSLQRAAEWERVASVELFNDEGLPGFQIEAGLRVQGGSSRNPATSPKHSLSLRFRTEYGSNRLDYPMFSNSPVESFSTLSLRAGSNNTWFSGHGADRSRAQYLRDQFTRDSLLAMGQVDAGQGTFVHLYLNGLYWGLYNVTERPDADHYAEYFGGDDSDYDSFNGQQALDGTRDSRDRLVATAASQDWQAIQKVLDVDNYIDYNIINRYGSNGDLDASRNYRMAGGGPQDAPWHVYSWDAEEMLYNEGSTGQPTDPVGLRRDLDQILEYRVRFGDRLHEHLFNGGAMTSEKIMERYQQRIDELDRAIIGESARWGDHRRDDLPYQRDNEWLAEQTRLMKSYFPSRSALLVELYRRDGLYPSIEAPELNQHGGIVGRNFQLTMDAPQGTIYYTTDGSDPRLEGGAVNPAAKVFEGGISLTEDGTVKARALYENEWSALDVADFVVQSELALRISEVQAVPHAANLIPGLGELAVDDDRFEFVEVTNIGDTPIDLQGVRLVEQDVNFEREGIEFVFSSQTLAPGEQLVVAKDRAAFASRYGTNVTLAAGGLTNLDTRGEFGGDLDDDGELLTLVDPQGVILQQFNYGPMLKLLSRANGQGSSLELVDFDPVGDNGSASQDWQASRLFGGSPGQGGDSIQHEVVINEILGSQESGAASWIELYNATQQPIDVHGWYVGRPDAPLLSVISVAATIGANKAQVLDENQVHVPMDGARGGELWLVEANAEGRPVAFANHVEYPVHVDGITVGRTSVEEDRLVPLAQVTKHGDNSPELLDDVIISEINFNPVDYDGEAGLPSTIFEYVELFNRTDVAIDLTDWRLTGDVELVFRNGTIIEPGGTILAVNFSPSRTTQSNPFRNAYGIDKSVKLDGAYTGTLKDFGGTLRLERPIAPPDSAPYLHPYARVDEVSYGTQAPWPTSTAGMGDTLQRVEANKSGSLASNWQAAAPSPGSSPLSMRLRADANDDGRFDSYDLIEALQAAKYQTGVAATFAEGDWNRDGFFDMDDLLYALAAGHYEQAPPNGVAAALAADPSDADKT